MGIIIDKIESTDGSININVNQLIKYEDGLLKTIDGNILTSLTEGLEIVQLNGDEEVNISGEQLANAMDNLGYFIFYQEAGESNWASYLMEVTCQLGEDLPEIVIETDAGSQILTPRFQENNVFYFNKGITNTEYIKILLTNQEEVTKIQKLKFDLWTL